MADGKTLTLFDRLRDSGLLEPAQLEHLTALPEAADPDPRALGRVLLKRGWLTRYQIKQAAQGHAKELVIGPYLVLDQLGEGGMGQVYRARHRHMQRTVALKLIRKERLSSEHAVRRFYQEVQAAAQLHHPNVVTAFDAGPAGNAHYFAMELVEGTDLAQLVKEAGPLPAGQACEFIRQAALGLEHAREKGLVHRDIKPANLLASWDANGTPVVKVLDLGLARVQSSDGREKGLTQSGVVIGTPDYLAPEQALDSRTVDIRSDLYSLGCTLYYLLTGRPPFAGESLAKVLIQHQMEEVGPPPGGWESVPAAVRAVLRKLMAKRPEDRFQTPLELADALEPLCGATGEAALARKVAARKARNSDTAWMTVSGERGAGSTEKRSARPNAGEITQTVQTGGARKEAAVGRDNRRVLLIATGVGLAVSLVLALVLVMMLVRTKQPLPASTEPGPVAEGGAAGIVRPNADVVGPAVPQPAGPSPLNRLDPAKVDARERSAVPPQLPVVALLPGHADALTGVTFSPGGRLATTCRDGTVRLWDLTGAEPGKMLEYKEVRGPAGSPTFSPDGKTLAVASNEGVTVYDAADATPRRRGFLAGCTLTVGPGDNHYPEQILAFFPDGKTLLVARVGPREGSKDKALYSCLDIYSLEGGEIRRTGARPGPPSTPESPSNDLCVAVAPDLWLAQGGEHKTLEWAQLDRFGNSNGGTGHSPYADAIAALSFSPDGGTLALTTLGGVVEAFYDLQPQDPSARLRGGTGRMKGHAGWATIVGFTPDGKTFVTRGQDRFVVWWNPKGQPAKVREWRAPDGTHLWRFSPDGHYAALGIPGGRIALVRLSAPFQLP